MVLKRESLSAIKGKRKTVTAQSYYDVEASVIRLKGQSYCQFVPVTTSPELSEWVRLNTAEISKALVENGAVLFRGFSELNEGNFESLADVLCKKVINDNGEHTRSNVNGKVYTPVLYPNEKKILWHNENSYNNTWPGKIMFGCKLAAAKGGATPIVDSRKVLKFLRPELVDEFVEKGVMYVRTYDGRMGNSWQQVFQTEEKREVEEKCLQENMTFRWLDDERLQTTAIRPAVVTHPVTGDLSWFNQAQHWHTRCLDDAVRDALLKLCSFDELPRQCFFGDGSVISDNVMDEICQVYQALEIGFPWQNNDVMVVDNILMAHARNPYEGERKLLVSMGDLYQFTQDSVEEV